MRAYDMAYGPGVDFSDGFLAEIFGPACIVSALALDWIVVGMSIVASTAVVSRREPPVCVAVHLAIRSILFDDDRNL
jgi:hypothetical protein